MFTEHFSDRCKRLSRLLWYSGGRQLIIAELTQRVNEGCALAYTEARLLSDAKEKEVDYRRRQMRNNVITGGKV